MTLVLLENQTPACEVMLLVRKRVCVCVDLCMFAQSDAYVCPVSRETTDTQPRQPAAAEPALPRHGL